jgi:hypothetical protein
MKKGIPIFLGKFNNEKNNNPRFCAILSRGFNLRTAAGENPFA